MGPPPLALKGGGGGGDARDFFSNLGIIQLRRSLMSGKWAFRMPPLVDFLILETTR